LIVIAFRGFEEAVYVVTHVPDGNAQEDGLNVPPALLSLNEIVPESAVGELEVSVA
jgi:hypothetical protein